MKDDFFPFNFSSFKQLGPSFFLFFLAGITVFSTLVLRGILPNMVFILLYHWGVHRSFRSPFTLVIIGAIYDVFWGYPLGFHCLLLLGINQFIHIRRRAIFGKDFIILWIGAVGIYAVYLLFYALLIVVLSQGVVIYKNIFYQFLMTICCYPLMIKFITFMEKKMV